MLKTLVKTVTAAATPEVLTATLTPVAWCSIQPISGDNTGTGANTGRVTIGDSTVTNASAKGIVLDKPSANTAASPIYTIAPGVGANSFNLNDIWVAVAVNGEGVVVNYIQF